MSWVTAHGQGGWAPGANSWGECTCGQLTRRVGRPWLVFGFLGQERTKGPPSPLPTPSLTGKQASHTPLQEQCAQKGRMTTFLLPSIM